MDSIKEIDKVKKHIHEWFDEESFLSFFQKVLGNISYERKDSKKIKKIKALSVENSVIKYLEEAYTQDWDFKIREVVDEFIMNQSNDMSPKEVYKYIKKNQIESILSKEKVVDTILESIEADKYYQEYNNHFNNQKESIKFNINLDLTSSLVAIENSLLFLKSLKIEESNLSTLALVELDAELVKDFNHVNSYIYEYLMFDLSIREHFFEYETLIESALELVRSEILRGYPDFTKKEVSRYKKQRIDVPISNFLGCKNIDINKRLLNSSLFERDLSNNPMTRRKVIIHHGPTNSGKTYSAIKALVGANSGVFMSPLRLLAYEVYEEMNKEHGVFTSLKTGDEEISVPMSTHLSCTVEMMPIEQTYEVAVIDEAQMIDDETRGHSWVRAILGVRAKEVHICCSSDAVKIISSLIEERGETVEVHEHSRKSKLTVINEKFSFPKHVKKGDALVVFSKKSVLKLSSLLSEKGFKLSILYGSLPSETRRKQMDLFRDGETDILVTTDVIGMGVNLAIKRVVFMETSKFDGKERRELSVKEVQQIAGRAGRFGVYDEGLVGAIDNVGIIKEKLNAKPSSIDKIRISPNEKAILALPVGTLKERLLSWQQSPTDSASIVKKSISQELMLLNIISKNKHLSEMEMWDMYKAINIPFDANRDCLIEKWEKYLLDIIEMNNSEKKKALKIPELESSELEDLELYYKELELLYSMSKRFDLPLDEEFLFREKEFTSNQINKILVEDIKDFSHKCKYCKISLKWDNYYNLCNKCYSLYK